MLAQAPSTSQSANLFEIVGNRSNGPKRPRGLVFCDPADVASGWAVVLVVPNQKRPKAEVRFYGAGGLGRVTSSPDAFALQIIEPPAARRKYADLLPLVRDALPRAAQRVVLMAQAVPMQKASAEPETDGTGVDGIGFASAQDWVAVGDEDSLTSPTDAGLGEVDDDVPLVSAIEVPMASERPSTADARAAVVAFAALLRALVREIAAVALTLFARSVSWWNGVLASAIRSLQHFRDRKPTSIAPALVDTSKTLIDVVDAVPRPISAVGDSGPASNSLPRLLPSRVAPGLVSVELQSGSRS